MISAARKTYVAEGMWTTDENGLNCLACCHSLLYTYMYMYKCIIYTYIYIVLQSSSLWPPLLEGGSLTLLIVIVMSILNPSYRASKSTYIAILGAQHCKNTVCIQLETHMSYRQKYCTTNCRLLRSSLAEGVPNLQYHYFPSTQYVAI